MADRPVMSSKAQNRHREVQEPLANNIDDTMSAHPPLRMTDRPVMTSETRKRRRETQDTLANDVDDAVCHHIAALSEIAKKHANKLPYVLTLAGINSNRTVSKQNPTPYSLFCGMKLNEVNKGKENGNKTTLQELLKDNSTVISAEYNKLSSEEKEELVTTWASTKEERDGTLKKVTNKSVSKGVSAKLDTITNTCKDLNRLYQTEVLLLFCRGNVMHGYSAGGFATEGARTWLENAEVGHDTLQNVALQMEGFAVSGLSKRLKRAEDGPAKILSHKIRGECRDIIKAGLVEILKAKGHITTNLQMNYQNYELKIVEEKGVALIGWPGDGKVRNPGDLSPDECLVLRNALESKGCRWVILTPEELETRKNHNAQRMSNGEQVYGPPRKRRVKKHTTIENTDNGIASTM